jgi:dihydroorotate dehydrogenase electron transfer subunit
LFKARVVNNRHLSLTHSILEVSPQEHFDYPSPGQFYLLEVSEAYDPFLRRPFSVLRWGKNSLEFFIRLTGKGTALLRNTEVGDEIDVIGPLGSGFPKGRLHETSLIIAGGVGLASVFSLMDRNGNDVHLFYGASTSSELYLLHDLERLTPHVHISTDDGSSGHKGTVLDTLVHFLDRATPTMPVVYACGPRGMIDGLLSLLKERTITGYISFEERMACGIGACMGCTKKTASGMKRVCHDGPVFPDKECVYES